MALWKKQNRENTISVTLGCQTESVIDEMDRRKIPVQNCLNLTISYGISKKPKSEQRKDKSLQNNGSVGLYFGIIHISRIFQSG